VCERERESERKRGRDRRLHIRLFDTNPSLLPDYFGSKKVPRGCANKSNPTFFRLDSFWVAAANTNRRPSVQIPSTVVFFGDGQFLFCSGELFD
jgi:hypothetical protein